MDVVTGDIQFRSFFKGHFIIALAMNISCSNIYIITTERKLVIFDAQSMESKSELIVSDCQVILMELSSDDKILVLSDENSNLIKIDVEDV